MLEGLADDEVDRYLNENPTIVPLFEVDVAEAVSPYIVQLEKAGEEPDRDAIGEMRQAQEALELEMVVSQWVKASQLEEVNLELMRKQDWSMWPKKCNQSKNWQWSRY